MTPHDTHKTGNEGMDEYRYECPVCGATTTPETIEERSMCGACINAEQEVDLR